MVPGFQGTPGNFIVVFIEIFHCSELKHLFEATELKLCRFCAAFFLVGSNIKSRARPVTVIIFWAAFE